MQKIGGNHWRPKWVISSIKLYNKPPRNPKKKEMLKAHPMEVHQKKGSIKRNKLSVAKDIA